jgi:DNA-binding transcriptional LysR family regulator
MKIPSHQLEAFVVVAQTGHFTNAAKKLNVTQSALSQRVLNLEDFLQTSLFIRDRSGLRLTAKGEELLRYCHIQQQLENEFISDLNEPTSEQFKPTLRIAAFSSVSRSLLIPSLSALIQDKKIQFHLFTRELGELPALLNSAEVDYLITDRKIDTQSIESLFLGYEKNVMICAEGQKKKTIQWIIDHDEFDEVSMKYVKMNKFTASKLNKRYLDDVYGLIDGVRCGLGSAVVPMHLIEEYDDVEIVHSEKILYTEVWLHFFQQPYYTKLHQQVIDVIQSYFRKKLDQQKN